MTFKPGDRVVVNNDNWQNMHGVIVKSKSNDEYGFPVRFDGYGWYLSDTDYHDIAAAGISLERGAAIDTEDISEPTDLDGDPPTPTYYDFPGGVQVRDISAHLTSFGGQALQYVARATRLDGNNKGEAVKDLRKAIDFIGWEIERLEAGND